jgi:hypothetical protein
MRPATVTERPPLELPFDADAVAEVGIGRLDASHTPRARLACDPAAD